MVQTPTESISAFPRPDVVDANGCGIRKGSDGMALRDWFAGQALPYACRVNQEYLQAYPSSSYPFHAAIAKDAYEIADAMLAARAQVSA